jgi:3-dehydroquinate synthase class II
VEKQMAVNQNTGASTTKADDWKTIQWENVIAQVKRLQMRIAKATEKLLGQNRMA